MNQNHCQRFVLLTALALPLFAQDPPAVTAPPKAQGPVLVVKTARPEVAGGLAASFDHAEELPDLAADAHYVLSLGADRKLKVESATGDVGLMQVTGDPGGLMDLFAEPIEMGKAMFRGAMTMALQPQGFTPKDVAAFVDELFALPRQMEAVTLNVVGDPEAVVETGLDITLLFEPKGGSGFATTIEALQPCSQGAPVLGGGKAVLQMQASFAPASLQKMFAPFRAMSIRMMSGGGETLPGVAEMYDKMLKLYDGGFGLSFDEKFQGAILLGVLDAEAMQRMLASDEYVAVMKAQKSASRDMEVEVTPNALEHRGTKLTKYTMTNDGPPNPVMPDGVMEMYFCTLGGYFLGSIGKEEAAKALVDAVAEQKVKRAPLAAGVVFDMTMDLKAVVAAMQEQMGGGPGPDEDMPAKMTMTLGKSGKALRLAVHVK